jgi:predicted amidohydrolase YtcJ
LLQKIISKGVWANANQGWMGTELWLEDGAITVPQPNEPHEVIDFSNLFLYPAFRDGHCHPLFAGRERMGIDLTDANTVERILAKVHSFSARNPSVKWLVGGAYDRSLVENGAFLAAWIDKVENDKPVVLHASDHHTIWVNTKAMQLAGVYDLQTLDVTGGSIDVDEYGKPTGVFREWPAMKIILDQIPALRLEDELDSLEWAHKTLLDFGVVEVQDAWVDRGMPEIYIEAAKAERLLVKTQLALRFQPDSYKSDLEYFERVIREIKELNNRNLSVNAAKFFIDGILGSATALLLEPYENHHHQHATHGDKLWSQDDLLDALRCANNLGLQVHMHAIGDGAVRSALDAVEALRREGKPLEHAPVIAHAELIHDEDIARFGSLGVIANFQPLWAKHDSMLESSAAKIGWARANQMYPIQTLLRHGTNVSFGSDWPVSSANPLLGIATAATRKPVATHDEPAWRPEERVSLANAWHCYSEAVHKQLHATDTVTMARGQKADFIALTQNCFEVAPEKLGDLKVQHLFANGKQIY